MIAYEPVGYLDFPQDGAEDFNQEAIALARRISRLLVLRQENIARGEIIGREEQPQDDTSFAASIVNQRRVFDQRIGAALVPDDDL